MNRNQAQSAKMSSTLPDAQNSKNEEQDAKLVIPVGRRMVKYLLLIITFAVLLYWGVTHPEKLISIVGSVFSLLSPFLIGLCIAFVINMVLNFTERLWDRMFRKRRPALQKAKGKRPICLTVSLLLIAGAIFIICFIIIPELKRTGENLVNSMPLYLDNLENWWEGFVGFLSRYSITLPEFSFDMEKIMDVVTSLLRDYGNNFIDKTVNITTSIVSVVVNFVLGLVFSIYLLSKKETIGHWVRKTMYALLPKQKTDRLIELAMLTNSTFTKFVTGQLTEACILGLLCFVGMLILRMPYAAVVSVMVGVTALIPVFGAFIGTAVGAFLILLVSPMKAFWFVLFIIVLQQVEGNLIYPRVVGKSVGLPGILVLTAVTLGGGMAGVTGVLFGVPICSVLYTVARAYIDKRLKEKHITLKAK